MSDLVVASFRGEHSAGQALEKLLTLEQKQLVVDLKDAVVAVRDRNGKVRLEQAVDTVTIGAERGLAWGALLGTLVGVLLLSPLAGLATGLAIGAGAGALSGALADYGIEDDFIKDMARKLEPGSSALFTLLRRVDFDKLRQELEPFGGQVMKASLTGEQEKRLRKALQGPPAVVSLRP